MKENANILIVDDNASMLRTTTLILERKGYTVTTAPNGPTAIDRVKEQDFDIVFLDIKMPVMNGVETYRRIKEIKPEVAVMMMTAYAVEGLVQQALDEGAYGIIYKPLDIERVLTTIEKARAASQGAFVLVVDDDAALRRALQESLNEQGYRVSTAKTGEEAVALVQETAPDIVFVDVRLPTINGLETYLKINEINPETVAVMMTAYENEMQELVKAALYNNAYACLRKPFNVDELLTIIQEIKENQEIDARG